MGLKSRSNKKSASGSRFPCTTRYTARPLQYDVMSAGIIRGVLSQVGLAAVTPETTSMPQCKLIFVWTIKVSLLGCYHNFKVQAVERLIAVLS